MEQAKIDRINHLAHKYKTIGLTPEEEQAERKREENGEKILLEGNVERKSELAGKRHKIFFEVAPGGQKVDSEETIADAEQTEAEDDGEDVVEEELGETRLGLLSVLDERVEAEKTENKREKEKI